MKDHKDNFQNNPNWRLISTAKSEIGIVSKHYIEEINKNIRRSINANQWRSTQEVISWFKGIRNNENSSFTNFDIVDFYPSISKDLLRNAMNFASTIKSIDKKVIGTITHSRKSLLFSNNDIWVEKDNLNLDVTMVSFSGGEVCELVGLY